MMKEKLLISRETIKPSSPTPSHLHTYYLSSIDQLAEHSYVPVILFYPNNGDEDDTHLSSHYKAQQIKKSLSKTLTHYYPFAGRLSTPYVDCNDEGVVFLQVKHHSQLETFQYHNHTEQDETLDQLFADDLVYLKSPRSTSLLGVQLNHFACGGLAVAVSMSHIVGDGCTLGSFLSFWGSVARCNGSIDHLIKPHIIHSPITHSIPPEIQVINQRYANLVCKKFLFPNSKLSVLKNKVSALVEHINNPTRVEVLTSLLYKTAMAAAMKKTGCFKPSYLFIPMNIRNKFVQKLPQTTVGNFLAIMMVKTRHTSETSLGVMVSEIQKEKSKLEVIQSVQEAVENYKSLQMKIGNDQDLEDVAERSYWCSSRCGFPYNEVDFGWRKPAGVTFPARSADKIGFFLMDTRDGEGIEALVILEKEDMENFQNDKEMLTFCQIDRI